MARLRSHGLQARDIAVIPAAAGGPKGLILQALDQWLFGQWLPASPRQRSMIGASIGAWRMAAACQLDAAAAFARLGELYCAQRYTAKPSPQEIDLVCQQLLSDFVSGHEHEILQHPHNRLHIVTARGKGLLTAPRHRAAQMGGFAAAGALNLGGRDQLARLMERVVIGDVRDSAPWLRQPFDAFTTHFAALTEGNLAAGLLASGTLPLVMEPVRTLRDVPPGTYWDGGMIDYHLAYPYSRMAAPGELVLYPHFSPHIVPGWLDKALPWRRAARGPNRHWLDNVILAAPSAEFVRTLPRAKLPDRQDFPHYGLDHDARLRAWHSAITAGSALRDEFIAFVEQPNLDRVRPL
jgi:hypothetical protein